VFQGFRLLDPWVHSRSISRSNYGPVDVCRSRPYHRCVIPQTKGTEVLVRDCLRNFKATRDQSSNANHTTTSEVQSDGADSPKKRKRQVAIVPIQSDLRREENQILTIGPSNSEKQSVAVSDSLASSTSSCIRKYPLDPSRISNKTVRESIVTYFRNVWDVPADGNCGYYVLLHFLQEHGLLPSTCRNVTDLRRTIYEFALDHQDELLAKNSYFVKLGYWKVSHDVDGTLSAKAFRQDISRIYNESVCFEGGCDQEYWMNANIVMPLVALQFDINIWLLSADGDPYFDNQTGKTLTEKPYTTMFTLTNNEGTTNVDREVVEGTVAFPLDALHEKSSFVDRKTAFVIHIQGNHYIAAEI
jgi:hypothetical protein